MSAKPEPNTPRQYKDVSGFPCTLDWLVKNEPEWAANQIRHRDKLEADYNELRGLADRMAGRLEMECGKHSSPALTAYQQFLERTKR